MLFSARVYVLGVSSFPGAVSAPAGKTAADANNAATGGTMSFLFRPILDGFLSVTGSSLIVSWVSQVPQDPIHAVQTFLKLFGVASGSYAQIPVHAKPVAGNHEHALAFPNEFAEL